MSLCNNLSNHWVAHALALSGWFAAHLILASLMCSGTSESSAYDAVYIVGAFVVAGAAMLHIWPSPICKFLEQNNQQHQNNQNNQTNQPGATNQHDQNNQTNQPGATSQNDQNNKTNQTNQPGATSQNDQTNQPGATNRPNQSNQSNQPAHTSQTVQTVQSFQLFEPVQLFQLEPISDQPVQPDTFQPVQPDIFQPVQPDSVQPDSVKPDNQTSPTDQTADPAQTFSTLVNKVPAYLGALGALGDSNSLASQTFVGGIRDFLSSLGIDKQVGVDRVDRVDRVDTAKTMPKWQRLVLISTCAGKVKDAANDLVDELDHANFQLDNPVIAKAASDISYWYKSLQVVMPETRPTDSIQPRSNAAHDWQRQYKMVSASAGSIKHYADILVKAGAAQTDEPVAANTTGNMLFWYSQLQALMIKNCPDDVVPNHTDSDNAGSSDHTASTADQTASTADRTDHAGSADAASKTDKTGKTDHGSATSADIQIDTPWKTGVYKSRKSK